MPQQGATTSSSLSKRLLLRLDQAGAAEAIANDPALAAEVAAALPQLRAIATTPAGEDGVKAVVGRRFATYPQPERSAGEWAEFWRDYVDACADLPVSALEAGMQQHLRGPQSEFLPKPGPLRALALRSTCPEALRYATARKGVDAADEAAIARASGAGRFVLENLRPKRIRDDPAEKAEQLQRARDWMDQVDEARRNKPAVGAIPTDSAGARIPSPGEMAPGRHVTKAMVEALARQRGDPAPVWRDPAPPEPDEALLEADEMETPMETGGKPAPRQSRPWA